MLFSNLEKSTYFWVNCFIYLVFIRQIVAIETGVFFVWKTKNTNTHFSSQLCNFLHIRKLTEHFVWIHRNSVTLRMRRCLNNKTVRLIIFVIKLSIFVESIMIVLGGWFWAIFEIYLPQLSKMENQLSKTFVSVVVCWETLSAECVFVFDFNWHGK